MDDNTQNNGVNPQPAPIGSEPASDSMQGMPMQQAPAGDMNMQAASLGDIAGMTPPPAPMQNMSQGVPAMPEPAPVQAEPAPVMPAMDMTSMSPSAPSSPMPDLSGGMGINQPYATVPPMPLSAPVAGQPTEADDYSYAEDLLDEILDSLDRIEAKLEAIEKKMGQ